MFEGKKAKALNTANWTYLLAQKEPKKLDLDSVFSIYTLNIYTYGQVA